MMGLVFGRWCAVGVGHRRSPWLKAKRWFPLIHNLWEFLIIGLEAHVQCNLRLGQGLCVAVSLGVLAIDRLDRLLVELKV
jgi:hypothetical protein